MALRRMVPTNFFKDPDILSLSKREHRQILLGLILFADDEGRELAHAPLLSREMGDYSPDEIEAALTDLADNNLIVLYQVGKHRYYSLTQWSRWQTINPKRMTPSKHPAPPKPDQQGDSGDMQALAGEIHADSGELPAQFNVIEFNVIEDEGGEPPPPNVVTFPSSRSGDGGDVKSSKVTETTAQAAHILKIPVTSALTRIIQEFLDAPVSLLGEADAAREWIDDHQRNKKRRQMSTGFFRRWLERECKSVRAASTTASARAAPAGQITPETNHLRPAIGAAGRNLMDLEAQYRAVSHTRKEGQ